MLWFHRVYLVANGMLFFAEIELVLGKVRHGEGSLACPLDFSCQVDSFDPFLTWHFPTIYFVNLPSPGPIRSTHWINTDIYNLFSPPFPCHACVPITFTCESLVELTHMQPHASLAIPSERGMPHVQSPMPAQHNNNKNDHLLHNEYFNTLPNLGMH